MSIVSQSAFANIPYILPKYLGSQFEVVTHEQLKLTSDLFFLNLLKVFQNIYAVHTFKLLGGFLSSTFFILKLLA